MKYLQNLTIFHLTNEEQEELRNLKNLKNLTIRQSKIQHINVLNDLKKLQELELTFLPKLMDVSSLSAVANTLEVLEIEACSKIKWQTELQSLKHLKKLLLGGFKFENIHFVDHLPNLEHLSLVDSNVLDGDISPAKNIKYVGIGNRRHYNYRFDYKTMKIYPKTK